MNELQPVALAREGTSADLVATAADLVVTGGRVYCSNRALASLLLLVLAGQTWGYALNTGL